MSAQIVLTVYGGEANDVYDLAERVRQIADELSQGYNSGDGWITEVEDNGESS